MANTETHSDAHPQELILSLKSTRAMIKHLQTKNIQKLGNKILYWLDKYAVWVERY